MDWVTWVHLGTLLNKLGGPEGTRAAVPDRSPIMFSLCYIAYAWGYLKVVLLKLYFNKHVFLQFEVSSPVVFFVCFN